MQPIWTIAKREFKSIISSPFFYVILGIFAFVTGIQFLMTWQHFDLQLQQAQLRAQLYQDNSMLEAMNLNEMLIGSVVGFSFFLFIFAIPALAAPSIAEERKQGTYELLFTSPLSTWQIILGKILANFGFVMFLILTHGLILAIMFIYGNPEWGPVLSGYLGIILFALAATAISVFGSSLTTSTILAWFISVAILLGLLMIGWAARVVPGNLATFFEQTAIDTHFQNFNKGVISVSALTYFITLAVLFWASTNVSLNSLTRK